MDRNIVISFFSSVQDICVLSFNPFYCSATLWKKFLVSFSLHCFSNLQLWPLVFPGYGTVLRNHPYLIFHVMSPLFLLSAHMVIFGVLENIMKEKFCLVYVTCSCLARMMGGWKASTASSPASRLWKYMMGTTQILPII